MKNENTCPNMQCTVHELRRELRMPEQYRRERSAMKNKNIPQSMYYAFQGMKAAWREERNFREYAAIYSVFALLNLLCGVTAGEFLIGFGLVCGVFSAEYFNTALERLIDTQHPEISADNKFIKDTAAAGVFILSIAFFLSQAMILLPKIFGAVIS